MITIEEYRNHVGDTKSSNEHIKKKIEYLTALCRNMANLEIESYRQVVKSESEASDFEQNSQ